MSAVWDCALVGPTKRLVLLALADNANDEGECWPSVATLSRKTGLCERAVRTSLRQLEADGWISTLVNGGRRGANRYAINPAPDAPGIKCPPAPDAPHPRHQMPPPPAPDAPEPPFNHHLEPSFFGDNPPKPKKRGCQLPDGWVPNDINVSDAMKRGFSEREIEIEADQFRNHHRSKGSTFKCWDAAWRTWLGNARKFGRSPASRPGPSSGHSTLFAGFHRASSEQ